METTDIFKSGIAKRIKQIILETLEVKEKQIVLEAKFVDDLGTDSLDLVEMVMALEDYYEIEISDEDAEKLVTVQAVIDYITRCLKEKGEDEGLYPTYSI